MAQAVVLGCVVDQSPSLTDARGLECYKGAKWVDPRSQVLSSFY